jgi:hypothetical protein
MAHPQDENHRLPAGSRVVIENIYIAISQPDAVNESAKKGQWWKYILRYVAIGEHSQLNLPLFVNSLWKSWHMSLNSCVPLSSVALIVSTGVAMVLRPKNGSDLHLIVPEQTPTEHWWEGGSSTGNCFLSFVRLGNAQGVFSTLLNHQNFLENRYSSVSTRAENPIGTWFPQNKWRLENAQSHVQYT